MAIMNKSPRKPVTLDLDDDALIPRQRGDISYWKGAAGEMMQRFEYVAAGFHQYHAEYRADRESWEAEQDALWDKIVKLREQRARLIGFAIGAIVVAVVALVMAFEIKRGMYAR
jgi:hypothetical protein